MLKYGKGDKSGITFGVITDAKANEQKSKTSFDYSADINTSFVWGMGGSLNMYNTTKVNSNTFK